MNDYQKLFKDLHIDSIMDTSAQEQACLLIKEINNENQFWITKKGQRINPIPNLSGGSAGISEVTEDIFSKDVIPDAFMECILAVIKNSNRICLYVHNSPGGFYPIFGVIYNNNNLIANTGYAADYEYILKFTESHVSKPMFEEIKTVLYSTENIAKHKPFLLEKIHKIEHYEY